MDTVWAPLADLVDAVLAGELHNPTLVAACWRPGRPGSGTGTPACGPPMPGGARGGAQISAG